MADQVLTVAEVAGLLKLHQQTVRNWIFSTVSAVALEPSGFKGGVPAPRPWATEITHERLAKKRTTGGASR